MHHALHVLDAPGNKLIHSFYGYTQNISAPHTSSSTLNLEFSGN